MRRRFTTALALLLVALPLAAETQQAGKVWRIGYLAGSPRVPQIDAFVQGLRDLGYVEGQNLVLEMKLAHGRIDQIPPTRGRPGSARSACDRRRRERRRTGGEEGNEQHPHRRDRQPRWGEGGTVREPRPTGWQRHGARKPCARPGCEALGMAQARHPRALAYRTSLQVLERGYEGLVGKDEASPYREGRTLSWLKVKQPKYREGERGWEPQKA